jgi:hypothetical protein
LRFREGYMKALPYYCWFKIDRPLVKSRETEDCPYEYHQFAGRNMALPWWPDAIEVAPNTWVEIRIRDAKAMKRYNERPFLASNGKRIPGHRCEICYDLDGSPN